jgi:hypothetical protein
MIQSEVISMDENSLTCSEGIKFLKLRRARMDRLITKRAIPDYGLAKHRLFDRDERIR